MNFTTAQRYVDQLVDLGMLRESTGQERNRVYQAEEVLRAIEEPLEVWRAVGLDSRDYTWLIPQGMVRASTWGSPLRHALPEAHRGHADPTAAIPIQLAA